MLGERRLREGLARLADRDDGAVGFALVVEIAGSYLSRTFFAANANVSP